MQIISPGARVGWIGTGVMGSSMCRRLMEAGYRVTVYTRTRSKADELLKQGAVWTESPAEAAAAAQVVVTMVGFPRDVRDVILGDRGALAGMEAGAILVDMTSSEPSLAVAIYESARRRNVAFVDAPVSGGDVGAREGRLSIMAGGDAEAVEALRPLWACLGHTVVYHGPAGSGQHAKLVNQILVAAGMVGVCEALLYGRQAGLDLHRVLESVSQGAAGSWALSNLAPRILTGDFSPGFYVEHFIKDLGIALEESKRMGLTLPGLALAASLYQAVQAQGHGRDGTQALILAMSKLSATDWMGGAGSQPSRKRTDNPRTIR
jgi:3-hydroxyisobutyrate dehydrogenase